jgi:glycosyltransferase involved in cell wall biosynthesis
VTQTSSVIICTYNYARFLGRCLGSVVNQTQLPDEIIVVDDGSDDETEEVVRRFPSVTYIRQNRGGKASAFSHGFNVSTGDVVCHLDADDYWMSTKLESTLRAFASKPSAAAVMHQVVYVDNDGNALESLTSENKSVAPVTLVSFEDYLSTFMYSKAERRRLLGVPNTISVRRPAVESYFPLPNTLGLAVDGALLYLAARNGLVCLASQLSAYRHHGLNSFVDNPNAQVGERALFDWLIQHPDYGQSLTFANRHLLQARALETELIHLCHKKRRSARGFGAGCELICHMVAGQCRPAWKHLGATVACILPEVLALRAVVHR